MGAQTSEADKRIFSNTFRACYKYLNTLYYEAATKRLLLIPALCYIGLPTSEADERLFFTSFAQLWLIF